MKSTSTLRRVAWIVSVGVGGVWVQCAAVIESCAPGTASPGSLVTITGHGFGVQPGAVVVTGRRVAPQSWSDSRITFTVPEDAATGWLRVEDALGLRSAAVSFGVTRPLPPGQIAPYGMRIEETGLLGSAFLVETDGTGLYGITGFETLSTYSLQAAQPHVLRSRVQLNQRVADLRVRSGYLFVAGDHGLVVFRCADLRAGNPAVVASIAGGSYLAVDARPDPAAEVDGLLVALSEHAPRWGTTTLRAVFYRFDDDELTPLGTFTREAASEERQFAIALDPLDRKAYVSGWISLTGLNKYLLELSTTNLLRPTLQHRLETGAQLAGDMDTLGNLLWTAVTTTTAGTETFQVYTLKHGTEHLGLSRVVQGGFTLGRVGRVRIVDNQVTLGSTWYGNRPDLFLLSTIGDRSTPLATANSLDWAFDVTGFARPAGTNAGKMIVADEWGGFITLDYQLTPRPGLTHRLDYQWVLGAAMTENLHLAEDRLYVAGRGAGPWSANPQALGDESAWRRVAFDWTQPEPQPHPVSALCTRRDPEAGFLIAALGHEKAMAWGEQVIGLLYEETASGLTLLAQSEAIDPPGVGSVGVSAIWPERDLVFMATGSDGFRAYVVDPSVPSLTLHRDCRASGFATNVFSTALAARCFKLHSHDAGHTLVVGATPGLLVGTPTLNFFTLTYPKGVPDRHQPDRPIQVTHDTPLQCTKWKSVSYLDVRPSGWVAIATSSGVGLFHLSWVPALNQMNDFVAWNRICVPTEVLKPWWHPTWSAAIADVSFGDDHTLYLAKAPEGVWRLTIAPDPTNLTHRCLATGYYPGVSCGMDYRLMLHGWADPDIPTLHHPYGVVADGAVAYVTGWSGKVHRLVPCPEDGVRIQRIDTGAGRVTLTFWSPFGDHVYEMETAPGLSPARWTPQSETQVRSLGGQTYEAQLPLPAEQRCFYRVRVRP